MFFIHNTSSSANQNAAFVIAHQLDFTNAQYPEIANQSNCAILGGSRVVRTTVYYLGLYYCILLFRDILPVQEHVEGNSEEDDGDNGENNAEECDEDDYDNDDYTEEEQEV